MTRSPRDFFDRLSVHAREDALDFQLWWNRTSPPTEEQIAEGEKKLGLRLRADHRELITLFGAGAILANEEVWPRPKEFEVRPLWQFQYGFEIFGIDPGGRAPLLDVVVQSEERAPGGENKLVAAAHRIGSPEVIGYDSKGKLFVWSRFEGPEELEEESLVDVLWDWLVALEEDKERMKHEQQKKTRTKRSTKKGTSTEGAAGKKVR